MIDICMSSSEESVAPLCLIEKILRQYLRSVHVSGCSIQASLEETETGPINLFFTDTALPAPYLVQAPWRITLSNWGAEGIERFTGISQEHYFAICSLMALAQWRALMHNPLLNLEDFEHPEGIHCLYNVPAAIQEFALRFEKPTICNGCYSFYHCLGADTEMIALRDILGTI